MTKLASGKDAKLMNLQVLIAVAGSPSLLDAQLRAISRCFPANTEVFVVDDSRARRHSSNDFQKRLSQQIKEVAHRGHATYLRMPQHLHLLRRKQFPKTQRPLSRSASVRTADSVQYGLGHVDQSRPIIMLDSDMLPISTFDPMTYFQDAPVWYLPQARTVNGADVVYPWPGIFFKNEMHPDVIGRMNWDCDIVDGVALDTGGAMHTWLKQSGSMAREIVGLHSGRWKWRVDAPDLPRALHEFLDFDAETNNGTQFCELFLGSFLHMRAGSNWNGQATSIYELRRSLFIQGINQL